MPEQLVIETCLINFGDDKGGIVCEAGQFVEPNADTARELASYGRTLYTNVKDDRTKGRFTASTAMIDAARAAASPAAGVKPAEKAPA